MDTAMYENEIMSLEDECAFMMKTIKHLREEEISLRYENKILAREIINCGYGGEPLILPASKTSSLENALAANRANKKSFISDSISKPQDSSDNYSLNQDGAADTTKTKFSTISDKKVDESRNHD
eukprot:CAMPEP_0184865322 /NCGR_PEP_ID=MMETSP0580-20130426/17702_1 /TAXON_ID=1118495 /ORGANISM="Dactyliosolen fragilissimus" /LENGTH=124 /DNA_ID=CAMNT_0027364475 /DNA_START=133 /DNA_END=507 /DNA_ORIENTATION=+